MPTLLESPPPLSGGLLSVADLPGRFCLAMTRGRCEKALANGFLADAAADPFREPGDPSTVHYYLPLAEQVQYEGKRGRYVTERPLFANYIFCSGHPAYVAARVREIGHRRGHLVSVSEVPERAQAKLRADLLNIETALRMFPRLESCGHVVIGGRYRVKAGPLMGVEGKAIQRGKATLFVLEVDIIGKQVPMEIDADLLEDAA
jgi:transcription antitermination factor NusG